MNISEEQFKSIVSEIEDKQTACRALYEITKCLVKISELQIGDKKMQSRMNKLWLAICDLQEQAEREFDYENTPLIPFSAWSYDEKMSYIKEKALES